MKWLSSARAFTIVELLVALTITGVLAAIMLAATSATLTTWTRSQAQFTMDAEAGLALDFLERDLEGAIFRDDGGAWLAADIINTPATLVNHGWLTASVMKPAAPESVRYVPSVIAGTEPMIADARFGLSGVWLRLITANMESGGNLPVAVAYQIARRPVSGAVAGSNRAAIRYSLFRSAVTASTTFGTGYNLLSGYASSGATPPAQRSAGSVTNPNTAGDVLATNVVDFGVWFYRTESSGDLTRLFPVNDTDISHVAATAGDFPEIAEVMVRVLSNEGAALIGAMESTGSLVQRPPIYSTDAAWWWAIVEGNSRVYRRWIQLRSAAR